MSSILNQTLRGMQDSSATGIPLALQNVKTKESNLFIGVEAALQFTLTNRTGGALSLPKGATITLIWPQGWFAKMELDQMKPVLEGFSAKNMEDEGDMAIEFTAESDLTWKKEESLSGKVEKVTSQATPGTSAVVMNFDGFEGDFPMDTRANLILLNPPQEGNAQLGESLHISLDSQGMVLVSGNNDPIPNTLFLNLKNRRDTSLFTGTNRPNTAKVTVRFVYGSTPGALAPSNDRDQPVLGSAWLIRGGIEAYMGNTWEPRDPRSSDPGDPEWVFRPTNDNIGMIGTGDKANVTFSFSNIISFTQPGHTQMIVLFSGFMANETQKYDDAAFILDIPKQNPPPTRGILNLFSRTPIFRVNRPNQSLEVMLRWAMFHVATVDIFTGLEGVAPNHRTYHQSEPVHFDEQKITLPGVTQSTALPITLQSYNGAGGFLNSAQFTVFIQADMFKDTRDGKVYPAVQIGNKLWMAKNLAWKSEQGSKIINNAPQYIEQFGYHYTLAAAKNMIPPGWRLPSEQDWQDLFNHFEDKEKAYQALMTEGESGFDAQLGGMIDDRGTTNSFRERGYYWTDTPDKADANQNLVASFSKTSGSVSLVNKFRGEYFVSVRLVRDIN